MKQQDEYTEEDRIYGAWLGLRGRINKLDYGQAVEDFPGSAATSTARWWNWSRSIANSLANPSNTDNGNRHGH